MAVIRNAWAHHFDGGGDGLFDGFVGRASPAKLGSARLTSPLLDHHVVSKYREAVSTIQAYHRRRAPVVVTMISIIFQPLGCLNLFDDHGMPGIGQDCQYRRLVLTCIVNPLRSRSEGRKKITNRFEVTNWFRLDFYK